MAKYDGWTLKCGEYLRVGYCDYRRSRVIKHFEREMGRGTWKKYRGKGFHKIVKIKLIEVE